MLALFLKSCSGTGYLGLDNWLNPLPVKEEARRDKYGLEPLIWILIELDQACAEVDISSCTQDMFEPLFKVLVLSAWRCAVSPEIYSSCRLFIALDIFFFLI